MQQKKHILVLSQYFYPEPFRINDLCEEWVKRGYKVTVLTGIPNYPQGKFYDGYGFTKKRKETWKGMDIIRIPLTPRGKSSIGMVINYLSFVVSGFFWKTFTKIKADYIFMYEVSPMTQALVGVWYAKRRKIPCYLYVQDLWPENVEIVAGIKNRHILNAIDKMVRYIYKGCDKIFATSKSFVKEIQKKCEEQDKVSCWPQYAEEFYKPYPKTGKGKPFVITFTGNIGYAQGLGILSDVAAQLRQRQCNVLFRIVGDGRYRQEFVREIEQKEVADMFELVGQKPAKEVPGILATSDSAFLSFADNPLFAKTIPAKLQSYMACGMPIIASATGETEAIIAEAKCGVCCAIGDAQALADSIEAFVQKDEAELKQMGEDARAYYEKYFDKQMLIDSIDKYFS